MAPTDERTPLLRDDPSATPEGYSEVEAREAREARDVESAGAGADEELKPVVSMAAIMVPMSIGIFLAAMDNTVIASSYARIGSELAQLQNTGWIATGYMLTLTSFQPLYGKLSDIFGRKACLVFAYTVFAAGCLFCGLAQTMTQLIAARALAGVGGGGMTTVASIVMSDVAPLRSRGTWQGIGNIVFATGAAAGAPLGGFLADTVGWRWSFGLQVPLAALAVLSVGLALKMPKAPVEHFGAKLRRVDFGGALALVGAVFCLLLALDRGGNVGWRDHFTLIFLGGFAVLGLGFAACELWAAAEPFAPRRIVADRALLASYAAYFFALGAGMTQVFMVTLYFQAAQGRTAGEAGLVLLPSIVAGVGGSLAAGVLMQATGKYYWLTVLVFVGMLLGHVLVPLFAGVWTYSYLGITVGLCLGSIGTGAGTTTTLIALIANAGPADQAIATAVSYLFRSLGSVVCLSLGETLLQDRLRHILYARLAGEQHIDEIIQRVRESLTYIGELEPALRAKVIGAYADALHTVQWFTAALTACALLAAFFIKEKPLTK